MKMISSLRGSMLDKLELQVSYSPLDLCLEIGNMIYVNTIENRKYRSYIYGDAYCVA